MPGIPFRGETYNDDRMFVLYLCKCAIEDGDDNTVTTTICHESAPEDHKWCIVTYRNTARYPAIRVDHFDSFEPARAYLEKIEPTVPLISLGGESPRVPLSYDEYAQWKAANQLREYDYASMYSAGGHDHREVVISPKR